MSEIIKVDHVSFAYDIPGGRRLKVLGDISFSANSEEFVSIVGQSGSGKSTLLRIIAGLMAPTGGRILYNGREVHHTMPDISFVFQDFALLPWLTNLENVKLGLSNSKDSNDTKERRATALLKKFGLKEYMNSYPNALSGGMKQRVGIARAIVSNPTVLLMDEPFSSLDELTAENLRKDIVHLLREKTIAVNSIIMVTHNVEEALELSDKIVVFSNKPTIVKSIHDIKLKYPRSRRDRAFNSITDKIVAELPKEEN